MIKRPTDWRENFVMVMIDLLTDYLNQNSSYFKNGSNVANRTHMYDILKGACQRVRQLYME